MRFLFAQKKKNESSKRALTQYSRLEASKSKVGSLTKPRKPTQTYQRPKQQQFSKEMVKRKYWELYGTVRKMY